MRYIELEFVFHLYTIKEELKHPGMSEFGTYDVAFVGSDFVPCCNQCFYGVLAADKKLKFVPEVSSPKEAKLYAEAAYERGDDLTVVLRARIDCRPWPERDTEYVTQLKQQLARGELSQRWWFHHITLPDGSVIETDRNHYDLDSTLYHFTKDYVTAQIASSSEEDLKQTA